MTRKMPSALKAAHDLDLAACRLESDGTAPTPLELRQAADELRTCHRLLAAQASMVAQHSRQIDKVLAQVAA